MDDSDHEDQEETGGGGGFQVEILKSYLSFAGRALKSRLLVVFGVLAIGIGITSALFVFIPRTFSCTTVLMTLGNPILDGSNSGANPFAGASDLILRHENLTSIIEGTGLVSKADARRPTLLKLKDRAMRALFGEMNEKTKVASLVGTLEGKIEVSTDKGDLAVKADWSDGATAAELAGAARESFLKARRTAEIAAFEEKMSILDGHATTLRDEVDALAKQLQAAREERRGRAREEKKQKGDAASAAAPAAASPQPVRVAVRQPAEPDGQLPALTEKLAASKQKLAELSAERERRLREAQAKFEEMKLRLTPSHPEVITQGERVAMLSQVPSDVALLKAEIRDLESDIKQRSLASSGGTLSIGAALGRSQPAGAAPLPPEITDLLDKDDMDPALMAQLSSTVIKYAGLRDQILSARIDLDTAQAAFNHRYQLIVPAEVPSKPIKPKPAMIIGAGLAVSILLALLIPLALELRTGIMIERWQVQAVQLPVLAELHLPPYSSE